MLGGRIAVSVAVAEPPGPVLVPLSVADTKPLTLVCGPAVVTVTSTLTMHVAPAASRGAGRLAEVERGRAGRGRPGRRAAAAGGGRRRCGDLHARGQAVGEPEPGQSGRARIGQGELQRRRSADGDRIGEERLRDRRGLRRLAAGDGDVVDVEQRGHAVVGGVPAVDAEVGEPAGVRGVGERGILVDEGRRRRDGAAVRREIDPVGARMELQRRRPVQARITPDVEREAQAAVVGRGDREFDVVVVGEVERRRVAVAARRPRIGRVADCRVDGRGGDAGPRGRGRHGHVGRLGRVGRRRGARSGAHRPLRQRDAAASGRGRNGGQPRLAVALLPVSTVPAKRWFEVLT